MNFLIPSIILLNLAEISLQDCVWYGQCNEENGKFQNCLSKEPGPFPFRDEATSLEILRQKCPFFMQKYPVKEFCCDDDQVKTMERSMNQIAGIFARCPTCMINLIQHVCLMTCAPNQTEFLEATDVLLNEEGREYVKGVTFYVSEDYLKDTFESCKEITVPSTGEKVVDISCGIWGSTKQCTPERWFEFFGDYDANIIAPFHVNYVTSASEKFKSAEIQVLPCNQSYESSRACSCSDCEASCTIPFEFSSPAAPFTIGSMDGVAFISELLFSIVGIAVFVLLIRHHCRGKSTESPESGGEGEGKASVKFGDPMMEKLEKLFCKWGTACARRPVLMLAFSSWAMVLLTHGATNIQIETDPIKIWASPTCKTRLEKNYFDTRFAPFYRLNQVFIKSKNLTSFNWTSHNQMTFEFGPAFNIEFLEEVFTLQKSIQELGADSGNGLNKVCFAPMKNEFFNDDSIHYCMIQSVWGYLQNDIDLYKNDTDLMYEKLLRCLRSNYDPTCLAPYGGPIFTPLAVGGHRGQNQTENDPEDYLLATGLSLTFFLNNPINKTLSKRALNWEKLFLDFLKEWKNGENSKFMEIAFLSERSLQDEIERETNAELTTVLISYAVMFIYITLALGRITKFSTLLLETKFTLGLGGIIIVLASVTSSIGVFGYLGVPTTLLTIEVIPFLVLAVGVDNIFIIVNHYQKEREKSERSIEENIGMTLGKVGPSILLTSASEAACFLIGGLSDMPAIKTFAEYSSLAIVINFLLQITCFVSILALDSKREEKNYADVFCCIRVKNADKKKTNPNILFSIFNNYYGPFLMKPWIRPTVIMAFLIWLFASISFIPRIEKGLDQELALLEDSYVVDYFQFMKELLSVGPPVYFVIKNGLNFTEPAEVNAVCGSVGCDSDSLVTYLTRASKLSNISYLAKSPSSWIDDYFDWLLSSQDCCKQFPENGSFCPHQIKECESCNVVIEDFRPQAKDFKKYLPYFLNDNPDFSCSKAGHAAYSGGVNFEMDTNGDLQVKDNYFMSYHTSLKTSRDFYMALENSRNIANYLSNLLSTKLNQTVEVFPYSFFYVFYEVYLNLVEESLLSLGLSLLAVFVVTFLFTGFDLNSALLVLLVVTSILVNMAGMLYWWNIPLNAISLVNLIVAVGIGVEFCSHIVHSFRSSTKPDRISKAKDAIGKIGTSVFSGITLTKFLGIIVMAFAQTLMLRIFYFKMYMGIVVIGATHGLILMPVMLSYFG